MNDQKPGLTFESVVRAAGAIGIVAAFWYVRATVGDELPEEWQPYYIAGVLLVLLPGYLLWERHRSRAFREAAGGLGLIARADKSLHLPFSVLPERSPRNMAVGQRGGQEVVLFEFRTGSRRHRHTHTAVAYRSPEWKLSKFLLRPEGGLAFLTALVGMKDIDFAASPEFSHNYLLTGRDERKIRTLFDQGLLEFFKRETGWTVEGHDEWLLVYRDGVREKPDRLSQFLHESGRVADLFARPRWDDQSSAMSADATDPRNDEVMHPMTDASTESASRAYAASFIQGLVSPYGLAIMFTLATAVTTWRQLGDLLPGRLVALIVVGWSLAVGAGVFVVSAMSLPRPSTDSQHHENL